MLKKITRILVVTVALFAATTVVADRVPGVNSLNAQVTIELPDWPEEAPNGICRCHTSGENQCLGGNQISLRRRCGGPSGCDPSGPC
ncbi:MAG: hypothetical protein ABW007_20570 [Chitinophagaceae bacterium]